MHSVTMSSASGRGAAWSDAEIRTLIGLWADKNIQREFDVSIRNKEIYQKVAKDMQDQGYDRE